MVEVTGFWIQLLGSALLCVSGICATEERIFWLEKKLRIPWYVLILAPVLGIMMLLVGWHVWCTGNKGRYPGYPLEQIIEWFR